jgi:hypothetical protein
LYSQEDNGDNGPEQREELLEYTVDYETPCPQKMGDVENTNTKVNDFKLKRIRKSDGSYQSNVTLLAPSGSNIKNATFKFYYKDNNYLLGRFGADTITMTVTDEMGQAKEEKITGENTKYIEFDVSNPISFGTIMAKDDSDAYQKLQENLTDVENMKIFDVKVTIKHGEKLNLFGLFLERLLDKDGFTLDVTFEYYVYEEVPPEGHQDDDKDTSLKNTPLNSWASTPYVSTNYLGYH